MSDDEYWQVGDLVVDCLGSVSVIESRCDDQLHLRYMQLSERWSTSISMSKLFRSPPLKEGMLVRSPKYAAAGVRRVIKIAHGEVWLSGGDSVFWSEEDCIPVKEPEQVGGRIGRIYIPGALDTLKVPGPIYDDERAEHCDLDDDDKDYLIEKLMGQVAALSAENHDLKMGRTIGSSYGCDDMSGDDVCGDA
jgi:hypothetical protein